MKNITKNVLNSILLIPNLIKTYLVNKQVVYRKFYSINFK